MKYNQVLFHNDKFNIYKSKSSITNHGFRIYYKHSIYFKKLYEYIYINIDKIHKININNIENNNLFNKDHIYNLKKFILLYLFYEIIQYIQDLIKEDSDISKENHLLFSTLRDNDHLSIRNQYNILIQFSFDLFIHFYEENNDINWIKKINYDILDSNIKEQKEKEYIKKQNIIDNKSKEQKSI